MFNDQGNFQRQQYYPSNSPFYSGNKFEDLKKDQTGSTKKIIIIVLVFLFVTITAVGLGLIPVFIKLAKGTNQPEIVTNQTLQNNSLLQGNDPLSQLFASSDSDFNLKTGSVDFAILKTEQGNKLSGVKDFDYEILDLRPTVPNVLFETEQKLNNPQQAQQALEKQPIKLEEPPRPILNVGNLELEQPIFEPNLEQEFPPMSLQTDQLQMEPPVAARKLKSSQTELKKEIKLQTVETPKQKIA
ncbi:unnamed protein product [Brachionus calyciflorus]|uniref:Uncharacterized protein n=1 Tax=Brachionus calyciflorus TaxID=104777 RepID=A0A813QWY8_9BILA|nr:unnamed protein product [Brachionus calyciflorus]